LVEFCLIAAIGFAVYAVYVLPANSFTWYYPIAIFGVAACGILAFQTAGIYRMRSFRSRSRQYARLVAAWLIVFLLLSSGIFLGKLQDEFSRVWTLSFFLLGLAALAAFRMVFFNLIRHWARQGRLTRRTVIVGGGELGEALIEQFKDLRGSDVRLIGLFDDRNDERSPSAMGGQRKLGTVDDLVEFARRTRIDLIIFSLPISAEARILEMLQKLWVLPVDIRLAAHTNKLQFRPRSYSYLGNVPVLDVFDRPIADWDIVMRWLFDKIVGGLILLAAAPVMALIALAIKLDSRGPVLFKQKRYGFNNELIGVYKFRSMYAEQTDAMASKLVTRDDPRVTRVGRFIRKTSLDELPQLFNVVLKGNLSLVGPRPHAVNAQAAQRRYDEAVDGYFARHRVKPGITGWAQINGWRGETDTAEKIQARVEHDLYYIENWSLLLDLYILARTPFALFSTENAY
jgi:Undecaprenyl-phosphate glucose phosphotransferase